MSNIERDERVWFIHGPTGWTKFDREPGYAVRATGKIEILGPLVPAEQLAGAVAECESLKRRLVVEMCLTRTRTEMLEEFGPDYERYLV